MDFESKYIDELILLRKEARENKDWKLSDEIRKFLDDKLVFIFDTKDNDNKPFQEVHYLTKNFFEGLLTFKDKDGIEIFETKMERYSRLHNKTFKSKREFLEFTIQQEINTEKRIDAWLYSIMSSKEYKEYKNLKNALK